MRFQPILSFGTLLGLLLAGPVVASEVLTAGTGNFYTFLSVDVTEEKGAMTFHYQFLWPEISQVDLATEMVGTEADTSFLCTEIVKQIGVVEGRSTGIVITLTDRLVAFGVAEPDATQIFESYVVTNGDCIWEAF